MHTKFIGSEHFNNKIRYFKSEIEFKEFIQFCNKNLIPIIPFWLSNCNGSAIRWLVFDFIHNKPKCDEADKSLMESTISKQSLIQDLIQNLVQIKIETVEELKLLGGVSEDIEKSYFNVIYFEWNYRNQKEII